MPKNTQGEQAPSIFHMRPKVRFRGTADAGSTLSAQAVYRRRRSRRQFQNLVKAPALLFHFGVQRHSPFRSRCATCIRQWRSIARGVLPSVSAHTLTPLAAFAPHVTRIVPGGCDERCGAWCVAVRCA